MLRNESHHHRKKKRKTTASVVTVGVAVVAVVVIVLFVIGGVILYRVVEARGRQAITADVPPIRRPPPAVSQAPFPSISPSTAWYNPLTDAVISLKEYDEYMSFKKNPLKNCTAEYCKGVYGLAPKDSTEACSLSVCQTKWPLVPKDTTVPLDRYNELKTANETLTARYANDANCSPQVCANKYPVRVSTYREGDTFDVVQLTGGDTTVRICVVDAFIEKGESFTRAGAYPAWIVGLVLGGIPGAVALVIGLLFLTNTPAGINNYPGACVAVVCLVLAIAALVLVGLYDRKIRRQRTIITNITSPPDSPPVTNDIQKFIDGGYRTTLIKLDNRGADSTIKLFSSPDPYPGYAKTLVVVYKLVPQQLSCV